MKFNCKFIYVTYLFYNSFPTVRTFIFRISSYKVLYIRKIVIESWNQNDQIEDVKAIDTLYYNDSFLLRLTLRVRHL